MQWSPVNLTGMFWLDCDANRLLERLDAGEKPTLAKMNDSEDELGFRKKMEVGTGMLMSTFP
jgi:hypothetical protein